jgi:hypothetical protein
MKRELELRTKKLLQEQKNAGKITNKQYKNELEFIRQIKKERDEKLIKTNRPETTIQMEQRWSTTITTISQYQFRENRTR